MACRSFSGSISAIGKAGKMEDSPNFLSRMVTKSGSYPWYIIRLLRAFSPQFLDCVRMAGKLEV